MKFQAAVAEISKPLTVAQARCVVVPDDAFDGVFGDGINLQFPYQHRLDRTQLTCVVNRYVVYVLVKLKLVAVTSVLLAVLSIDFKKRFPYLGEWGKDKVRSHSRVLKFGWRNRRCPAKQTSYAGLTISTADMQASDFAQKVAAAGFGIKAVDNQHSFTPQADQEQEAPLEVSAERVELVASHPQRRLWGCCPRRK